MCFRTRVALPCFTLFYLHLLFCLSGGTSSFLECRESCRQRPSCICTLSPDDFDVIDHHISTPIVTTEEDIPASHLTMLKVVNIEQIESDKIFEVSQPSTIEPLVSVGEATDPLLGSQRDSSAAASADMRRIVIDTTRLHELQMDSEPFNEINLDVESSEIFEKFIDGSSIVEDQHTDIQSVPVRSLDDLPTYSQSMPSPELTNAPSLALRFDSSSDFWFAIAFLLTSCVVYQHALYRKKVTESILSAAHVENLVQQISVEKSKFADRELTLTRTIIQHEEANETLKKEIVDLKSKVIRATEAISAVEQLRTDNADLKANSQLLSAKCATIEQELESVVLDKQNGEQLLASAMERMLPLIENNNKLSLRNEQLQLDQNMNIEFVKQAKVDLEEKEAAAAELRAKNEVLADRLAGMKGICAGVGQQLDEMQQAHDELRQAHVSSQLSLKAALTAVGTQAAALVTLQRERDALLLEASQLSEQSLTEKSAAINELRCANEQLLCLQHLLEQYKIEVSELQVENKQLLKATDETCLENNALRSSNATLLSRNQLLEDTLLRSNIFIGKLRAEYAEYQIATDGKLASCRQMAVSLTNDKQQLQDIINTLSSMLQSSSDINTELEARLSSEMAHSQQLSIDIEQQRSEAHCREQVLKEELAEVRTKAATDLVIWMHEKDRLACMSADLQKEVEVWRDSAMNKEELVTQRSRLHRVLDQKVLALRSSFAVNDNCGGALRATILQLDYYHQCTCELERQLRAAQEHDQQQQQQIGSLVSKAAQDMLAWEDERRTSSMYIGKLRAEYAAYQTASEEQLLLFQTRADEAASIVSGLKYDNSKLQQTVVHLNSLLQSSSDTNTELEARLSSEMTHSQQLSIDIEQQRSEAHGREQVLKEELAEVRTKAVTDLSLWEVEKGFMTTKIINSEQSTELVLKESTRLRAEVELLRGEVDAKDAWLDGERRCFQSVLTTMNASLKASLAANVSLQNSLIASIQRLSLSQEMCCQMDRQCGEVQEREVLLKDQLTALACKEALLREEAAQLRSDLVDKTFGFEVRLQQLTEERHRATAEVDSLTERAAAVLEQLREREEEVVKLSEQLRDQSNSSEEAQRDWAAVEETLSARVAALSAQIQQLLTEKAKSDQDISKLREFMRERLRQWESEKQSMLQEKSRLQQDLSAAAAQLNSSQSCLESATAVWQQEKAAFEENVLHLIHDKQSLQTILDQTRQETSEYRAALESLSDEINSKEHEWEQTLTHCKKYSEVVSLIKSELRLLQTESDRYRVAGELGEERERQLTCAIASLTAALHVSSEAEVLAKQRVVDTESLLLACKADYEATINEAIAEKQQLASQLEGIECFVEQYKRAQDEVTSILRSDNKDLSDALDEKECALQQAETKLGSAIATLTELQSTAESLREEVGELTELNRTMQIERYLLTESHRNDENAFKQLHSEVTALLKLTEQLRSEGFAKAEQLEIVQRKNEALEEQLATARESSSVSSEEIFACRALLGKALVALRTATSELLQSAQALLLSQTEAESAKAEAQATMSTLVSTSSHLHEQIDILRQAQQQWSEERVSLLQKEKDLEGLTIELQREVAAAMEAKDFVCEQMNSSRDSLSIALRSMHSYGEAIVGLLKERDELAAEVLQLSSELERANISCEQTKAELAGTANAQQYLDAALQAAETTISCMRHELRVGATVAAQLTRANMGLQSELEVLNAMMDVQHKGIVDIVGEFECAKEDMLTALAYYNLEKSKMTTRAAEAHLIFKQEESTLEIELSAIEQVLSAKKNESLQSTEHRQSNESKSNTRDVEEVRNAELLSDRVVELETECNRLRQLLMVRIVPTANLFTHSAAALVHAAAVAHHKDKDSHNELLSHQHDTVVDTNLNACADGDADAHDSSVMSIQPLLGRTPAAKASSLATSQKTGAKFLPLSERKVTMLSLSQDYVSSPDEDFLSRANSVAAKSHGSKSITDTDSTDFGMSPITDFDSSQGSTLMEYTMPISAAFPCVDVRVITPRRHSYIGQLSEASPTPNISARRLYASPHSVTPTRKSPSQFRVSGSSKHLFPRVGVENMASNVNLGTAEPPVASDAKQLPTQQMSAPSVLCVTLEEVLSPTPKVNKSFTVESSPIIAPAKSTATAPGRPEFTPNSNNSAMNYTGKSEIENTFGELSTPGWGSPPVSTSKATPLPSRSTTSIALTTSPKRRSQGSLQISTSSGKMTPTRGTTNSTNFAPNSNSRPARPLAPASARPSSMLLSPTPSLHGRFESTTAVRKVAPGGAAASHPSTPRSNKSSPMHTPRSQAHTPSRTTTELLNSEGLSASQLNLLHKYTK